MYLLIHSLLWKVLHILLNFSHVHFEVLIPLELALHGDDVLRVANLPIVHRLEVLLELIQLCPQLFPFRLDARQTLLAI